MFKRWCSFDTSQWLYENLDVDEVHHKRQYNRYNLCRETTWCGDPVSTTKGEGEEAASHVTDQRSEEADAQPEPGPQPHPSLRRHHWAWEPAGQGQSIHTHKGQDKDKIKEFYW